MRKSSKDQYYGHFRRLALMLAGPQIGLNEVAEAIEQGVTLIINNHPDGKSPDQIECEIEAAALGGINCRCSMALQGLMSPKWWQ